MVVDVGESADTPGRMRAEYVRRVVAAGSSAKQCGVFRKEWIVFGEAYLFWCMSQRDPRNGQGLPFSQIVSLIWDMIEFD